MIEGPERKPAGDGVFGDLLRKETRGYVTAIAAAIGLFGFFLAAMIVFGDAGSSVSTWAVAVGSVVVACLILAVGRRARRRRRRT